MMTPIQSANVYTDLNSLEQIQRSASSDSPETLRFVAQQFEALFMQMMLKSAQSTGDEDGLFNSEQGKFYQDWHDKQLAIHLAGGQGIGVAEMLVQQLMQNQAVSDNGITHNRVPESGHAQPGPRFSMPVPASPDEGITGTEQGAERITLDSPQAFIGHLLPMATDAADKLGVSAQVLLAQAALETGWGAKINRAPDGTNSHNLFNIKADQRWDGDRVKVKTLEYRDGVARRESAEFRAYDSYQHSFADYVSFIQSGARYQKALSVAGNNAAYTHELALAGYATDPDYSRKIMAIANGEAMQEAFSTVKL